MCYGKRSRDFAVWSLFILVSLGATLGLLWCIYTVDMENLNMRSVFEKRNSVVVNQLQDRHGKETLWKTYRNKEYGFETMCEYDVTHEPQIKEYGDPVPINFLTCSYDIEFYVEPNNTETFDVKGNLFGKVTNAQELYNFVYWITTVPVAYDSGFAFSESLARKHITNGPKITKEVLLDGIPSRETRLDNIIGLDNLNEDAWIVLDGKRIGFIDFTAPPATRYNYEIHIVLKDYLFTLLSNADTMDIHSGAGMILSHFRMLN